MTAAQRAQAAYAALGNRPLADYIAAGHAALLGSAMAFQSAGGVGGTRVSAWQATCPPWAVGGL